MQPAATRQRAKEPLKPLQKRWGQGFTKYIFVWALAISLLIHLSLLGSFHFYLPHDTQQTSMFEARLEPLPVSAKTMVKPAHPPAKQTAHAKLTHVKRQALHRRRHRPLPKHAAVLPVPAATTAMAATPDSVHKPIAGTASVVKPPDLLAPVAPTSIPVADAAKPQVSASSESANQSAMPLAPTDAGMSNPPNPAPDTTAPALNKLPDRFEIQYKVLKGINGFQFGTASYIWVAQDGQYTLTSITQGSGLFALFQPGKLVQISHGKIIASGLAPDDFWIQRGRATPDKTTAAHFDYVNHNVTITKDNRAFSVPMPDNAQDLLSAIFQLAIRAPFPDVMLLHVTSGKTLKPYHARIVGEEFIATPLGPLRTLHLVRPAEDDEDAMDLWLAEDYNYLPVKIRIDHSKYGVIEQIVTGMHSH
ncbi:MAG: DUF3108 domain-containing protein [Sulfuriferula sp.]